MITVSQTLEAIRDSSAKEVISQCIDRIEGGKFNTFITVAKESALEAAGNAEGHTGPLAGVPIGIKDNMSTRGIQTTCASKILEGYVPPYDAHVIECLKAAGAIIVGKVNMDEFAMGTSTETSHYGPTLNPWDPERVPGGSSGASAATVAAGEVPLSLGSDTGGSVRCPASFCGVVGLKPTYGVISRYGLISYANSLEQIGPIASNVEDMTLLFNVIAGHDPRDSTSVAGDKDYTKALLDDVKGLTIGVPKEYFGEGIDPSVEKSVWDSVHRLEDLGASWKEVEMSHTKYALAAYYVIAMSEASSNLARFDGMRYGLRLEKDHDWHTTYSEIRAQGFG
ncbi:MAG: aspartyl/glutamyl-tRNA amidotransferase subunit A, partial [Methanosarcinales archaeon]|nr:aspartyl/glutamyl-tRNA amidotransferase subunit A [Methanosarcinales archaeon]